MLKRTIDCTKKDDDGNLTEEKQSKATNKQGRFCFDVENGHYELMADLLKED